MATTPERSTAARSREDECTFEVRIIAAADRAHPEPGPSERREEAPADPLPALVALPMDAPASPRVGPAGPGAVLVPSLVRSVAVAG
jgi:hypothetical protein